LSSRFAVRADFIGLIHQRLQVEHDVGITGLQGIRMPGNRSGSLA
jgi:hypothetical protein